LGRRARAEPGQTTALAGAALLSAAPTWVQAVLISAALAPGAAWALLPPAVVGAAVCAAGGVWLVLWRGGRAAAPGAATPGAGGSALRPREAMVVALTLAGVAGAVGLLQQHVGTAGLGLGVALAALADAHAPIAALASLHAAGSMATPTLLQLALLAIGANTFTRCAVALAAGGWGYGWRVGLCLLGSLAAALAPAGLQWPF
jgi:uncharacterized membrane protein (DUF4010 family)